MPSKNIHAEGLDDVLDSLRGIDGLLDRQGRKFLREMGLFGVDAAQKRILSAGAVDTNELVQEMHYKIKGLQVTIRPSDKADEYAYYVEEGTEPHWAPRDALQDWADRHGIPVFLVQRKIAREGTEPRYMFRDTFDDFSKKADREVPHFIDELLRQL